jgi:hypothetical protein
MSHSPARATEGGHDASDTPRHLDLGTPRGRHERSAAAGRLKRFSAIWRERSVVKCFPGRRHLRSGSSVPSTRPDRPAAKRASSAATEEPLDRAGAPANRSGHTPNQGPEQAGRLAVWFSRTTAYQHPRPAVVSFPRMSVGRASVIPRGVACNPSANPPRQSPLWKLVAS